MASPRRDLAGISLVIPCFNGAAFIGEAIETALAQTRPPDEIIVIDDGSTDGSADVVRRYPARIGYIRQENGGEASARNRGLGAASGALVAFLDADDLWLPTSLETLLALLDDMTAAGFAFGRTEQFVSPGCSRRLGPQAPVAAPLAGATLFRRSAFDAAGLFDPAIRLGAMIDWLSRARGAGVGSVATSEIVLKRRIHDSNSVHDSERLKADYLRALRSAVQRSRAAP